MLEEHEIISQTEDLVNALKNILVADKALYREALAKLVAFYREYADGYHHRKEEEVLFPAIIDQPEFVLDGMVEELEVLAHQLLPLHQPATQR